METATQSVKSILLDIHSGMVRSGLSEFIFFLFRGQMVGKIGRQIKKLSNGALVVPRIYALDPAGTLSGLSQQK